MASQYRSPQAVPQDDVEELAAVFKDAAGGDDHVALQLAVRELLFLLPHVSQGMLRLPPDDHH